MREKPSWRIPVGIIGLLVGLAVYAWAVAVLVAPLIAGWPALGQLPVYVVLGVVWMLPLRPYLIWMEGGRRD